MTSSEKTSSTKVIEILKACRLLGTTCSRNTKFRVLIPGPKPPVAPEIRWTCQVETLGGVLKSFSEDVIATLKSPTHQGLIDKLDVGAALNLIDVEWSLLKKVVELLNVFKRMSDDVRVKRNKLPSLMRLDRFCLHAQSAAHDPATWKPHRRFGD